MGMAAEEMAERMDEKPPPRAIQFPPQTPIFFMEDWEIPLRSQLPIENALPYLVLIDSQLRVHFELNNNNWINKFSKPGFRALMDLDNFYSHVAPQIMEASLLKSERRLIGGIAAIFYPKGHYSDVHVTGLLPKEKTLDMDPALRRQAFKHIFDRLDQLNMWLGAKEIRSGCTVVTHAKMKIIGWEKINLVTFKELWTFYKAAFPIWLRRRQGYYVKKLG
jgi:hypothetical protein